MDSIRISLNSAQPDDYAAYYQPRNYGFADALESAKIARRFNRWASTNYFVFPGLTDHPAEITALERLIEQTRINMIQARNMNIDPEWYGEMLRLAERGGGQIGIPAWVTHTRRRFPWVKFGYFNPPREEMKPAHFAA